MYLAATQGKKDGHQALLADFLFRDAAGVFTITAQMLSKTAVTRYPERQVALMITDTTCIALQTSPEERPSVPPWFAEVVLIAQYLTQQGGLEALTSIGFLTVGAGMFPCTAFLSFSTFLFLL